MQSHPTRFLRGSFALGIVAALAVPGLAQDPVDPGDLDPRPIPICSPVPNGSFTQDFSSWTLDPCVAGFGEGYGTANATIEDLTSIGCDAKAACLNVTVGAAWNCDKPSGSAWQSQMAIERTAVVRGRYLKFKAVGGFEFLQFDSATIKYDAVVTVTNQDGDMLKCEVLSFDNEADFGCPNGIQALGGIPLQTICCDFAGTGIRIDDTVTIRAVWSVAVIACEDCDEGQFFGSFCVDDFEFCSGCDEIFQVPVDPIITTFPATSLLTNEEQLILDPVLDGPLAVAARLGNLSRILQVDLATGLPFEESDR